MEGDRLGKIFCHKILLASGPRINFMQFEFPVYWAVYKITLRQFIFLCSQILSQNSTIIIQQNFQMWFLHWNIWVPFIKSKICIELNQECDFLNLENNLVVNTEHVLCGFYFHVVLKAILRDLQSPVVWDKNETVCNYCGEPLCSAAMGQTGCS